MDDSCAVCADALEWVAYGACGHRDVCSTCVARLRFICDDRRCCICKTESDVVFITKALGNYTKTINDFSVLPSEPREGRLGPYWYHEDTQAFFDDVDHYKMVKAMCRLSCSVCDNLDEQSNDGPKRRVAKFRNIEHLKGHLFHQHRLFMCNLCLEGRKVFICEQKLYTRTQLNQHIDTGDSEVDGTESERGGFMGHPMCEFCRTPFYGDNELYSHMSTEHYTCHICQRQHPGQFEYYKNYDDLEIHFRRDHFLCEDDACLGKKFIVFQSEAEMKRHNALEHGGHMSRSQRSAALQIPTSFRYSRVNEQDHRRGRGRTFRRDRDSSDNHLSMAIQASLEMANSSSSFRDPSPSSSNAQVVSDRGDVSDIDPIVQPFDALSTADAEVPSKYLKAVSQNSVNMALGESSFPPLPVASSKSKTKHGNNLMGLPSNTLAAKLRPKISVKVIHPGQPSNASSRGPVPTSSSFSQPRAVSIHAAPVLVSNSAQSVPTSSNASASSSYGSSTQAWPAISDGPPSSSHASSNPAWPAVGHAVGSSGTSSSLEKSSSSSTTKIKHSSSAPNLAENKSFDASLSDFPPVSVLQVSKPPPPPPPSQPSVKTGEVHTANKALVEKMRAALEFDEEKYAAFREISGQFRVGSIGAEEYLGYVEQFGLSHLVLDLARLCPDAQKQRQLIEFHNYNMRRDPLEKDWRSSNSRVKDSSSSSKGKGKLMDNREMNPNDLLADNIIRSVRELQSSYRPTEVEVEVLSKDGYRTKGKSKVTVDQDASEMKSAIQQPAKVKDRNSTQSTVAVSDQNFGDAGGGSKQRKKTSKFHRTRLGEGSSEALLNVKKSDPVPDSGPAEDEDRRAAKGQTVRGAWGNGGSRKLFAAPANNIRKW